MRPFEENVPAAAAPCGVSGTQGAREEREVRFRSKKVPFFFSSSATSGSWRVAPRALRLRALRNRHAPVSCHARSDCCAGSPSRTGAWTWWRSAVVSGSKRRRRRAPRTARVAPRSAAADAREMKSSSLVGDFLFFSTWPGRIEAPRSCHLPDSPDGSHPRAQSTRTPRAAHVAARAARRSARVRGARGSGDPV